MNPTNPINPTIPINPPIPPNPNTTPEQSHGIDAPRPLAYSGSFDVPSNIPILCLDEWKDHIDDIIEYPPSPPSPLGQSLGQVNGQANWQTSVHAHDHTNHTNHTNHTINAHAPFIVLPTCDGTVSRLVLSFGTLYGRYDRVYTEPIHGTQIILLSYSIVHEFMRFFQMPPEQRALETHPPFDKIHGFLAHHPFDRITLDFACGSDCHVNGAVPLFGTPDQTRDAVQLATVIQAMGGAVQFADHALIVIIWWWPEQWGGCPVREVGRSTGVCRLAFNPKVVSGNMALDGLAGVLEPIDAMDHVEVRVKLMPDTVCIDRIDSNDRDGVFGCFAVALTNDTMTGVSPVGAGSIRGRPLIMTGRPNCQGIVTLGAMHIGELCGVDPATVDREALYAGAVERFGKEYASQIEATLSGVSADELPSALCRAITQTRSN